MLREDVTKLGDANFHDHYWDFGVYVYYEDDNNPTHYINFPESLGRFLYDVET